MAGGVDTQGSVLRPQPWAGGSQLLQSCRSLCKPLPEPSPKGGSSTSSPIPTLLKPLQGDGATTEAPSQPSSRGRNTNCWPIPAFFKVKEFQQKPLPTFRKGKERHPSALNTVACDSRSLGGLGRGFGQGQDGASLGLVRVFSSKNRSALGLALRLGRVILGLLPLAMPLEDYLPMTNSRVPPAMMSA